MSCDDFGSTVGTGVGALVAFGVVPAVVDCVGAGVAVAVGAAVFDGDGETVGMGVAAAGWPTESWAPWSAAAM